MQTGAGAGDGCLWVKLQNTVVAAASGVLTLRKILTRTCVTLAAAPLSYPDKTRTTDALKKVQLLDANVSESVAACDSAVDRVLPMIWNPVELAPINAHTFARLKCSLQLTHLRRRKIVEIAGCEYLRYLRLYISGGALTGLTSSSSSTGTLRRLPWKPSSIGQVPRFRRHGSFNLGFRHAGHLMSALMPIHVALPRGRPRFCADDDAWPMKTACATSPSASMP